MRKFEFVHSFRFQHFFLTFLFESHHDNKIYSEKLTLIVRVMDLLSEVAVTVLDVWCTLLNKGKICKPTIEFATSYSLFMVSMIEKAAGIVAQSTSNLLRVSIYIDQWWLHSKERLGLKRSFKPIFTVLVGPRKFFVSVEVFCFSYADNFFQTAFL